MRATRWGAAALAAAVIVAAPPAVAQQAPPNPETSPGTTSPAPTPPPSPTPAPTPPPTGVPTEPAPTLPDPYDPQAPAPAVPLPEETDEAARAAAAEARLQAERARVSRIAIAEMQRAKGRLAQLDVRRGEAAAEVAAAKGAEQALVSQHADAITAEADARRDLGNLARLAYTSGPTEWTLIETFLDAENPSDALRRASVSALVANRQDAEWDSAVLAVAEVDAEVRAATDRVKVAESALAAVQAEYTAVQDQVDAIALALATGALTGVDGADAVKKLCGDLQIPQCKPSGWGEGNLTRDAVWAMRLVQQKWPQIDVVGGYRPVDPYPDHPSGRAIDVMVPDAGRTPAGAALGDEIATYFMQHADEYGVMYLIWDQKIWMVDKDPVAPPDQWRPMADRGDWTSNHMDHVHVTFSTGVSGGDIYSVVGSARRSAAR